jgi:hypothetical protein
MPFADGQFPSFFFNIFHFRIKKLSFIIFFSLIPAVYIAFFFPHKANAGVINLSCKMSTSVFGKKIMVKSRVRNTGKVSCYDVTSILYVFGKTFRSHWIEQLKPGTDTSFQYEIKRPKSVEGNFPVVKEVIYHDGNRDIFSLIAHDMLDFGGKKEPAIRMSTQKETIAVNEKIVIDIENNASSRVTGLLTVYSSRNIYVPKTGKKIELDPFENKKITYRFYDRHGTGYGSYPALCVFTCEKDRIHYTRFLKWIVKTAETKNWFKQKRWDFMIYGFAFLTIFWVCVFVFLHRRRSRG